MFKMFNVKFETVIDCIFNKYTDEKFKKIFFNMNPRATNFSILTQAGNEQVFLKDNKQIRFTLNKTFLSY